jgi:hypothetical protein
MEELADNRFIKGTDTVERYLLNLVQEYFKTANVASTTSREYVIKKAVERMKEEITFDSIGVLSVTFPDGEKRTGAVTITLEDLNGEPLISPKFTAFNVNFGSEARTACEGNDPRLSDARKPLDHDHEFTDIVGLEGILSSLTGKVERVDDFLHEHENINILDMLVYTGNNSVIDLTLLETLEEKVYKLVDKIREEIIAYKQEAENKVTEIYKDIQEVKTQINDLKQYILNTNKEYYGLSKKYTDDSIKETKEKIDSVLETLVTTSMLVDALKVANNTYTFAGSMEFDLSAVIDFDGSNKQEKIIDINDTIKAELAARNQLLRDCQVEIYLQYFDVETNKKVSGTLPYIIFNDNVIDGSVQIGTLYDDNQIVVTFDSNTMNVPSEIKDARILYTIYSKQEVTLG